LIVANRPGRIVNVSSMSTFHHEGQQGVSLYTITKAGLNRMTEVLAVEWSGFGINVNGIAPGAFASEMMDLALARLGDGWTQRFPRRRMCDPALFDSTLLYLVSDASEAVTGTIIRLDDGQGTR
jgi:NAD(P)-dependent dehydrogenase (short-subunit alcohol dehydrogenase family)